MDLKVSSGFIQRPLNGIVVSPDNVYISTFDSENLYLHYFNEFVAEKTKIIISAPLANVLAAEFVKINNKEFLIAFTKKTLNLYELPLMVSYKECDFDLEVANVKVDIFAQNNLFILTKDSDLEELNLLTMKSNTISRDVVCYVQLNDGSLLIARKQNLLYIKTYHSSPVRISSFSIAPLAMYAISNTIALIVGLNEAQFPSCCLFDVKSPEFIESFEISDICDQNQNGFEISKYQNIFYVLIKTSNVLIPIEIANGSLSIDDQISLPKSCSYLITDQNKLYCISDVDLISLAKPNVIRKDNEIKPEQKYLFSIFCDEPKIETEYKFNQFDLNKQLSDPMLNPFLETRKSIKNLPKPSHPLNAITTIQKKIQPFITQNEKLMEIKKSQYLCEFSLTQVEYVEQHEEKIDLEQIINEIQDIQHEYQENIKKYSTLYQEARKTHSKLQELSFADGKEEERIDQPINSEFTMRFADIRINKPALPRAPSPTNLNNHKPSEKRKSPIKPQSFNPTRIQSDGSFSNLSQQSTPKKNDDDERVHARVSKARRRPPASALINKTNVPFLPQQNVFNATSKISQIENDQKVAFNLENS